MFADVVGFTAWYELYLHCWHVFDFVWQLGT